MPSMAAAHIFVKLNTQRYTEEKANRKKLTAMDDSYKLRYSFYHLIWYYLWLNNKTDGLGYVWSRSIDVKKRQQQLCR